MIQPLRPRASARTPRSLGPASASGAGDEQLVGRAEVRAPEDLDAVGIDRAERAVGVEHHHEIVDAVGPAVGASRRPVVICTAPPTRLSAIRWRAVSAWTLLMPGIDLVLERDRSGASGSARGRRSCCRTATGRPTPGSRRRRRRRARRAAPRPTRRRAARASRRPRRRRRRPRGRAAGRALRRSCRTGPR